MIRLAIVAARLGSKSAWSLKYCIATGYSLMKALGSLRHRRWS